MSFVSCSNSDIKRLLVSLIGILLKYLSLIILLLFISCDKELQIDIESIDVEGINSSILGRAISDNIVFELPGRSHRSSPSQLTIESKYDGNKPIIRIAINSCYREPIKILEAKIGDSRGFHTNVFYLPPFFDEFTSFSCFIDVPSESTLIIKDIKWADYDLFSSNSSINMHAHLGYSALETPNTYKSFEFAGKSGFQSCICNPISDNDGSIWCYHAGNETIIDNGRKVSVEVWKKSTREMQSLTNYNYYYEGYSIPTFEDYCRICAAYGMNATLSIGYLSPQYYNLVKETLSKFNLLEGLTLKDNKLSTLEELYNVFGDNVSYELYGIDCTLDAIDKLDNATLGLSKRLAEPYVNSLDFLSSKEKVEWCEYARSKGITLSLIQSDYRMDFKQYIQLGFVEYTSDFLPRMWE